MSNTGFYGKNRKRPAPAQKNFATENAAAAEENTAPENLVVGRNAVREVLRAGRDIEKLMVAKGDTSGSMRELVALAKEKNVIVHEVDRRKLDELAPNHQGIAAFGRTGVGQGRARDQHHPHAGRAEKAEYLDLCFRYERRKPL